MKNRFKVIIAGALTALGAIQIHAQSVTQTVTISLTAYVQAQSQNDNGTNTISTVSRGTVTTASVIQALGASVGATFDSKAVLQAISDTSGNLQSIVVADNGQQTDVTSFFTFTTGNFVSSGRTKDSTGAGTQTQLGTEEFALNIASGLSFDVQGFTTISSVTTFSTTSQSTTTISQLTASVAGSGNAANGNSAVFRGTISIKGQHVSNAGD
jgi:hypothetical protein